MTHTFGGLYWLYKFPNRERSKKPSLSSENLYKKECYKYLKQIKEIQNKLRELKIQKDF